MRLKELLKSRLELLVWVGELKKNDIFFHVGAGNGDISVTAASQGAFVQAFEPAFANFHELCQKCSIEGLQKNLRCWSIALSDQPGLHTLFVDTRSGPWPADAVFQEPVDDFLQPRQFPFEHGCGAATLDFFAETFGGPTHLLVDVGGFAYKVLKGAILSLRDTRLQSMAVWQNLNLVEHALIETMLAQCGMTPRDASQLTGLSEDNPEDNLRYIIYDRTKEPKTCQLDAPFYRKTPISDYSTTYLDPTSVTT